MYVILKLDFYRECERAYLQKKYTPHIDKSSLPVPRPQCNHMVGNVVYDKIAHSVTKYQNIFGHNMLKNNFQ